MSCPSITVTDQHAALANDCLIEIEGIVEVLRGLTDAHLSEGIGAAVKGMLLRIEHLADTACICWDEDPQENWGKSTADLMKAIHGTPPASLNAVSSLQRKEDPTR